MGKGHKTLNNCLLIVFKPQFGSQRITKKNNFMISSKFSTSTKEETNLCIKTSLPFFPCSATNSTKLLCKSFIRGFPGSYWTPNFPLLTPRVVLFPLIKFSQKIIKKASTIIIQNWSSLVPQSHFPITTSRSQPTFCNTKTRPSNQFQKDKLKQSRMNIA